MTERKKIKGPFTMRPVEMLKSPAFRVLSLAGHRIMARVEIELARHGGRGNGQLIVTHANFIAFGIDHKAVAQRIREVEALGLIELTQRGSAGNAQHHVPNMFRLTYLPTDHGQPTDDWKKIASEAEAGVLAAKARASKRQRSHTPKRGERPTPLFPGFPHPKKGRGNGHFPHPKKGSNGQNPHTPKRGDLSICYPYLPGSGGRAPAARPSRAANPKPPRRH